MSRAPQSFAADPATVRMPHRRLTAKQAVKLDALPVSIEAELAESGKV